ncbi:MAG: SIMPL domain-containing protein [Burkholderiaceae bacterium]|nr:SIMPL domain-containing protein [Burkholderiaceae bacterium]
MSAFKSFVTVAAATLAFAAHGAAPEALQTSGTVVLVQAAGDVLHANDQAFVAMGVEEQDKDKAVAASRVNQKMREGMDIVRRADPTASLRTQNYFSYPVYSEESQQAKGTSPRKPVLIGWRIGQSMVVTTSNLEHLSKTVAAAQKVMALNSLQFGLTPKVALQLEEARIAAAYRNLNERMTFLARAMGRNVSDAVLESLDFEGAGNMMPPAPQADMPPPMMRAAKMSEQMEVAEPNFEPGETNMRMVLVAKVRFK